MKAFGFALVAALAVASPLEERTNSGSSPLCGKVGYDREHPRAYVLDKSGKKANLAACKSWCASDRRCQGFAFGKNTCLLYSSSFANNFDATRNSPYTFYDAYCPTPSPKPSSSSRSPSSSVRSSSIRSTSTSVVRPTSSSRAVAPSSSSSSSTPIRSTSTSSSVPSSTPEPTTSITVVSSSSTSEAPSTTSEIVIVTSDVVSTEPATSTSTPAPTATPLGPGVNVITDPSFEAFFGVIGPGAPGYEFWNKSGGAYPLGDSNNAHTGVGHVNLAARGSGASVSQEVKNLRVDRAYVLTLYYDLYSYDVNNIASCALLATLGGRIIYYRQITAVDPTGRRNWKGPENSQLVIPTSSTQIVSIAYDCVATPGNQYSSDMFLDDVTMTYTDPL